MNTVIKTIPNFFKLKFKSFIIPIIILITLLALEIVPKFNNDIPVLMYHSIGNSSTSDIVLPKEVFEKQLKYLKDNGYTTLSMDELYDHLINHKKIPRKSVVLTFDDGYSNNYDTLYPLLKANGFTAAIFVQTNKVDVDKRFLTSSQIKELSDNGIEIGSHTVSHKDLTTLSSEEKFKELNDSKDFLEGILHKKVNYIAYPYGSADNETRKLSKEAGYIMAIDILDKYTNSSSDIYAISRRAVIRDMDNFKGKATKSNYYMLKYKVRKLFTIIKKKL